ncbi:MAG: hypothetical protein AAB316_15915 [Bacteroidota bacterium]
MKIKVVLFLLCAVLAAACAKKDPYEAFAKDFCECARPLVEIQKQLKVAKDSGNQEEFMALMEKGMKLDEESQTCLANLEKKHGKIEGEEEQKKAMEAMEKVCPDITGMMQGGQEAMPEDGMPIEPDTMEAQ